MGKNLGSSAPNVPIELGDVLWIAEFDVCGSRMEGAIMLIGAGLGCRVLI